MPSQKSASARSSETATRVGLKREAEPEARSLPTKVRDSGKKTSVKLAAAAPITRAQPPAAATHLDASKAPPRKGTFAEIIARAKSAQAAPGVVGVIKHKPIEKVSERERRALREQRKAAARTGRRSAVSKSTWTKKDGEARAIDVQRRLETPKKLAVLDSTNVPKGQQTLQESGYKGTANAARTGAGYKGTARSAPAKSASGNTSRLSGQQARQARAHESHRRSRGRDTCSEEEEDEDEDEEEDGDVESDASSDMEAAAFEVEDEEEEALWTAKQEDARAMREEAEHQRLKRERKLRLQAMARKRR